MNKESTSHDTKKSSSAQKIKWTILIGVVFSLLYFLFGTDPNIYQLYSGYQQVRALKLKINESNKTIDSLKLELKRLENDTAYLERIAREKLGMAKTNEKVFKFIGDKK